MTKALRKLAARMFRGGLAAALLLGLAGCPLQSPTFDVISPGLVVSASSAAPLVNQTITLSALSLMGADLAGAIWTTSDPAIVMLSSTVGASITAVAVKAGLATVTVKAGALHGAIPITVLASIGDVSIDSGPTSLTLGNEATYKASVTDGAGGKITATVTWVASGMVALATPGVNTGPSIRIRATGVGAGAVTAQAGGRAAQVAVKVYAMSGQLVITRADGTALPSTVAASDPLAVEASYEVTNEPADGAQWTATGACKLIGASGATLSVQATGAGACMLTATAKGMEATATFQIVSITGLKITGDTGALALGESRTFLAVGLADTIETGAVTVTWSSPDGQVLTLQPSANQVKVTGAAVGNTQLIATLAGQAMAMVSLTVAPTTIQLTAPGGHVLAGAGTVVTAKALGPAAAAGHFATATGLALAGATGFGTVGSGVLQNDGSVTFALGNATADSPTVTASFGGVTSNVLAFTIAQISKVIVTGPQGPVRIGSTADFTAMAVDAAGTRIDGDLVATWADATGVYQFPATAGLKATATAAKLGTAAIVATIMGVASAPYASPVQPSRVDLTMFSPSSVAVGGTATAVVTVFDAADVPVPNVPLSQVSLMADDGTKVSFDTGSIIGMGFQFTATGLAATGAGGVHVTATWTDGMFPVMSATVGLVVTGP